MLKWDDSEIESLGVQLRLAAIEPKLGSAKQHHFGLVISCGWYKARATVRILIVDDDEHVASGICMALTLRGYTAATCGTAEEALERLREGPWALVIADLRLPGMDGQQLLRHVAAAQPAARRILITGFGTPETELWARQEVDDCLLKPFTAQCLLQAVQRLLPAAPAQEFDEPGASNAGGQ